MTYSTKPVYLYIMFSNNSNWPELLDY